MNIADLNEIIQSGTKSSHQIKGTDTIELKMRDNSNRQLISTKMEDLRSHIKDLETKLDHTKNLIRTANKVTHDITERQTKHVLISQDCKHKRGDSQKFSENVLLSARRGVTEETHHKSGAQTAR